MRLSTRIFMLSSRSESNTNSGWLKAGAYAAEFTISFACRRTCWVRFGWRISIPQLHCHSSTEVKLFDSRGGKIVLGLLGVSRVGEWGQLSDFHGLNGCANSN